MKKYIFLIAFLLLSLCGCKDYVEVENLTIVTAIGIDPDENGYLLSLEVVKFTDNQPDVTIVQAFGQTYNEAITNAIKITGNELYFSHAQVMIINEEVEDIYPLIDSAYRSGSLRLDMSFLISTQASAYQILSTKSLIDDIAGVQIQKILESNHLISEVSSMPVYKFICDMSSKGISPSLPVVSLMQTQNDEIIREINGLAYFNGSEIYGYLDKKQAKTLNFLKNNSKSGKVIDEYDKNTPTFNLQDSNTVIKPIVTSSGLFFDFFIQMNLELIEKPEPVVDDFQTMEDNIATAVKKDIDEFIKFQIDNYSCDFLGLTQIAHRKYPSIVDIDIKNLNYSINVECNIISSGLVSNYIKD